MAWCLLRARAGACAHVRMLACWRAGVRGQANENGFALAYDNVNVLMYLLQCIVIRCHPMSSDVIHSPLKSSVC
jgi:hypothetical protein